MAAVTLGLIFIFLTIMSVWLVAAHGNETTTQIMQTAGIAWLGAHISPVTISGVTLGLLPWGFFIIPAVMIWKCTHWALKSSQPESSKDYWRTALLFSVIYAALCAGVATLSSTDGLSAEILASAIRGGLLALVISCACVATYAPTGSLLTDNFPPFMVTGIRVGTAAVAIMLGVGALITTISIGLHWNEMKSVLSIMAPGSVSGFFMILMCIGYLPTASVWAMSYVAGPGIWLGASGLVSVNSAEPGALPAFPLLSILPSDIPVWAPYLIAIPIALGLFIFIALPREHWEPDGQGWLAQMKNIVRIGELGSLAATLGVLGLGTWGLTTISSGSLGNQLLKNIGPNPIDVSVSVVTICGLSALTALLLPRFILTLVRMWTSRTRAGEVSQESAN